MRIMLIIPTNASGGAERVMSVLGNWLADQGHEVIVVNLDADSHFYSYPKSVRIIKLGVDYLPDKRSGSFPVRFRRDYCALNQIIQIEKPDGAIVFLNMAEICGALALHRNHIPFLVSIRNDPVRESFPLKLMRRLFLHYADVLVCQSEKVAEYFRSDCASVEVISNPLSADAFEAAPPSIQREKVILNVGRLEPQKNQRLLLDAFACIVKDLPDYKLVIVGAGTQEGELRARAQALGIAARVSFPGRINAPLIKYRDATCFVLSSDYEGAPNALIEAMANGLPCISTDFPSGAAQDILQGGKAGILIPCRNVTAMADSILKLCMQPELQQLYARAGLYVRDAYCRDTVCKQWYGLLETCVLRSLHK